MIDWTGAAALCLDDEGRLLMIFQGPPEEEKKWTVPAAVTVGDESLEEALKEEIEAALSCTADIIGEVALHSMQYGDIGVRVDMHYFAVTLNGRPEVPIGDELIGAIGYKTANELESLPLLYPDQREQLIRYIKGGSQ